MPPKAFQQQQPKSKGRSNQLKTGDDTHNFVKDTQKKQPPSGKNGTGGPDVANLDKNGSAKGLNDYQQKVLLTFDPTPIPLELREPIVLDPKKPVIEQLPVLQDYWKQRKELQDWEDERSERLNAGVKFSSLPEYIKLAKAIEEEIESGAPVEQTMAMMEVSSSWSPRVLSLLFLIHSPIDASWSCKDLSSFVVVW